MVIHLVDSKELCNVGKQFKSLFNCICFTEDTTLLTDYRTWRGFFLLNSKGLID